MMNYSELHWTSKIMVISNEIMSVHDNPWLFMTIHDGLIINKKALAIYILGVVWATKQGQINFCYRSFRHFSSSCQQSFFSWWTDVAILDSECISGGANVDRSHVCQECCKMKSMTYHIWPMCHGKTVMIAGMVSHAWTREQMCGKLQTCHSDFWCEGQAKDRCQMVNVSLHLPASNHAYNMLMQWWGQGWQAEHVKNKCCGDREHGQSHDKIAIVCTYYDLANTYLLD